MRSQGRQSGFTLVEVLVVLVIVAMVGALLTIGFNQLLQRKASTLASEIQTWLEAAADTAVLQSSVLGVTQIDNQLKLMSFFRGEWYLLADQIPLELNDDVQLRWSEELVNNAQREGANLDRPQPYLVLTPAGDFLPEGQIELTIGEQKAQIGWQESNEFLLVWQNP